MNIGRSISSPSEIQSRDRTLLSKGYVTKFDRKKTWFPKDQKIHGHCTTGEVETELHFLLYCPQCEQPTKRYLFAILKQNPKS